MYICQLRQDVSFFVRSHVSVNMGVSMSYTRFNLLTASKMQIVEMWKSKHAQCAGDGETKRATAAAAAGDLTVVDYRIILTRTGCRPPRPAGPPALLSLSLSTRSVRLEQCRRASSGCWARPRRRCRWARPAVNPGRGRTTQRGAALRTCPRPRHGLAGAGRPAPTNDARFSITDDQDDDPALQIRDLLPPLRSVHPMSVYLERRLNPLSLQTRRVTALSLPSVR